MTNIGELSSPERKKWPEPPKNAWYAVGWSKGLTSEKILRVMVFSKSYAVFRNNEGQVHALRDQCPHRLVPLSSGTCMGGRIKCPYHGWEFSEKGDLVKIPSFLPHQSLPKVSVKCFEVKEQDGIIWLNPSGESQSLAQLPSMVNSTLGAKGIELTVDLEGELLFAVENFLDATHTHFVHGNLIRGDQSRALATVKVTRDGLEVFADYGKQEVTRGVITRLLALGNKEVSSVGRLIYPSVARLEYVTNRHWSMCISAAFTPTSENKIKIHVLVTYKPQFPRWIASLMILPVFKLATRQDKWIIQLQAMGASEDSKSSLVSTSHDLMFPHIIDLWRSRLEKSQVKTSEELQMQL
jgi:phenylpropionate dioxygenase-like ring-hydroxylating dioxygenase large terminal subunit